MNRIPLATNSAELESRPASIERLLNLYAEKAPSGARSEVVIRATPGLMPQFTLPTGPAVEMNDELPGVLYVVAGTHFYRVSQPVTGPQVIDDLGVVGTPVSGPSLPTMAPSIAVGPTAAVVCVPPNAWVCAHGIGAPMNQITGTFPGGNSVAYLDGYWVFTDAAGGAQFFTSNLLSPTSYSALSYANADFRPNVIRKVIELSGDLWFMGEKGCEIWYDAGGQYFPLARRPGTDIPFGVISSLTAIKCDGSIFWVSDALQVLRSDGYSAVRVSTHAIEEFLRDNIDTLNIDACAYGQNGHNFYCLTMNGTAKRTLVYDAATKLWHNRASDTPGVGVWRGRSAVQRGPVPIIGDRVTGDIHNLIPNGTSDNYVTRTFQMVTPPIWGTGARVYMSRLELEAEVGDGGSVTLDKSDDGGWSFADARTATAGAAGVYTGRLAWPNLGSFRQRVLRFVFSKPPTVYALDAEISAGKW